MSQQRSAVSQQRGAVSQQRLSGVSGAGLVSHERSGMSPQRSVVSQEPWRTPPESSAEAPNLSAVTQKRQLAF